MSELEDRLSRFAYEWHEAMNSPYAVNMMPMLLKAASDVRRLVVPSLEAENAKLRELVRDMWRDGMCECDERGACAQCEYHFTDRMRDLRVEVDA